MLGQGDTAPQFLLPDQDGRAVALAELLEGGSLLLYFYPADFTGICTREACLFRDAHAGLRAAGLQAAGISTDTPETHRRFRDRYGLPFPLLSDPGKIAIRAFGVDGPFGIGVRRASFLIGADGRILSAVRSDFRLGPHARLLDRAAKSATAGPASAPPRTES